MPLTTSQLATGFRNCQWSPPNLPPSLLSLPPHHNNNNHNNNNTPSITHPHNHSRWSTFNKVQCACTYSIVLCHGVHSTLYIATSALPICNHPRGNVHVIAIKHTDACMGHIGQFLWICSQTFTMPCTYTCTCTYSIHVHTVYMYSICMRPIASNFPSSLPLLPSPSSLSQDTPAVTVTTLPLQQLWTPLQGPGLTLTFELMPPDTFGGVIPPLTDGIECH